MTNFFMYNYSCLVLSPFILFAVGRLTGYILGKKVYSAAIYFTALAGLARACLYFNDIMRDHYQSVSVDLGVWLRLSGLEVSWLLEFTSLSLLMTIMILVVTLCVQIFSFGYMEADPNIIRFFSYLSLFSGFMLLLVNSGNFIIFFIGWEGVGLSSFLLINFWTTRVQTAKSALKALLVNRVGDFFLLFGLLLLFKLCKTFDFSTISALLPYFSEVKYLNFSFTYVDLISVFLVISAISKSAQAGLHIWLPDAMEGPTPVSALIHAATMVTAGLYLLLRCSFIIVLSKFAMALILITGSITILFSSVMGIFQYDIKKIIAYSTCSQLGYIFVALGSSYFILGFYHLITHAFFKALLFLAAGGLIHLSGGEQDLRRLAGLPRTPKVNFYYLAMCSGSFSLMGLGYFSGFYSKELILLAFSSNMNSSLMIFTTIVIYISVTLTAFYTTRMMRLLFVNKNFSGLRYIRYWGVWKERLTYNEFFYELLPVTILVLFSMVSGYMLKNLFVNSLFFLDLISIEHQHVSLVEVSSGWLRLLPLILTLIGAVSAGFFLTEIGGVLSKYPAFVYFFTYRFGYDNVVNKSARRFLQYTTTIYFTLDKGLLEWFGPHGLNLFFNSVSRLVDFIFYNKRSETSFSGFVYGIFLLAVFTIAL